MSLFRIGANIQAMDSLRSLYHLNEEISSRQARLASGKRINTARDDTAGYAIARSLETRMQIPNFRSAISRVYQSISLSPPSVENLSKTRGWDPRFQRIL